MPVEIRTADGRQWARPVQQNHARLPLQRLVTPHERHRRQLKFVVALLLFSGLLMSLAALLKGI